MLESGFWCQLDEINPLQEHFVVTKVTNVGWEMEVNGSFVSLCAQFT